MTGIMYMLCFQQSIPAQNSCCPWATGLWSHIKNEGATLQTEFQYSVSRNAEMQWHFTIRCKSFKKKQKTNTLLECLGLSEGM